MSTIIILLTLALLLFFLEIFIPGGILAIFGGMLILAACVVTFDQYGWAAAILLLVASSFGSFILFFLEVKFLGKTPWGRRLNLESRIEGSSLEAPDIARYEGKTGEVISPLNPSGRIRIGEEILDASSESGWIARGETVRVTGSDVFHLRVRPFKKDKA